MSDEAGFRIGDELFPYPDSVEFGDSILIRRLAGLSMAEYAALDEDQADVALTCLVAMAVRHAKRGWSVDKVIKFIELVDFEGFEVVSPEEPDADPPAVNDGAVTSPEPSPASTDDAAEPSSGTPHPAPTGIPA